MNFSVVRAILRKDVLTLWPLLALTALLFLGDAVVIRLDLLPIWTEYGPAVLLVALMVLVMTVFQTDSPASLTDDWLCRPIRIRELLAAKFALVLAAVYLARALGALFADLALGFPVGAALLDAFLLPEKLFPFLLLFFLFAAIITRTFVQGFGVLFVIFICVFAIPTPFIRPPGPLTPGVRDAIYISGMHWLVMTPAKLAAMLLVTTGFWLVYARRRLAAARVLMAVTVAVTLVFVVLPMGLIPWTQVFAVQKAAGAQLPLDPAAKADAEDITLSSVAFCFPAARRNEISSDGAFVAAARGLPLWDSEQLGYVGPDSIAFVTRIVPTGLPLDWRVKLNYAQADYSAGGTTRYSLRPSHFFTDDQGGGALSHAWMLPEDAAQELKGASPRLDLRYSLTLLKPRGFQVPVDGAWHSFPELGVCRATDKPANRIDVDCFSAFPRYAQLSAELNDIRASRIYSRVDFEPGWTRWPYSERVKLTIGSSRLVPHESITVTAWDAAGYFDKSLALPGMLGADLGKCPLPGGGANSFQKSRWSDSAPHETSSISVDDGVQLEVLDFGGSGPSIVLLPGLGATAHSFDDLAPLLAKNHRVIAITRRGIGDSSKPDFGYDTPRRGQDVLAVMDELRLQKVLLVGHSIAGEELTWLGGHPGDRFSGLVYLDAAYDRSRDRNSPDHLRYRELGRKLPPEPPRPPEAMLNYEAMSRFLEERGHERYPEGELIALFNVDEPFIAGTPSIDGRAQQAIMAANQAPDYAAVKIPALAIYAFEDPSRPLPPWYDASDPKLRAIVSERASLTQALKRESIELFRNGVKNGRVIELQNATHYLLQSNQQEVLQAIEEFASAR